MPCRHLVAFAGLLGLWAVALPQPAAPLAPAAHAATIRYRIDNVGNERIVRYLEMIRYLRSIGFTRDPAEEEGAETEAEDPRASRMRGTIPADRVARLFRDRSVKGVLLVPKGVALP